MREKFNGPHTDRGRLYLLLGKPQPITRYSGEQELVECELWNYSGLSGRGLPPFLNFLFYKPRRCRRIQAILPRDAERP